MTKASAVIAPPSNSSTKDETRSIDVPRVHRDRLDHAGTAGVIETLQIVIRLGA